MDTFTASLQDWRFKLGFSLFWAAVVQMIPVVFPPKEVNQLGEVFLLLGPTISAIEMTIGAYMMKRYWKGKQCGCL